MSTYFPKGEIVRSWYVVDADGQTLGRLAARVARLLSGKENPEYTPFLDTGSHVVIINASKVRVTGLKAEQKKYHRYTGFPGGLRTEEFKKRFERAPERLIEDTITGMLPHTKLGRQMATKLKVYRGDKHPHEAQQPKALVIARKSSPKATHASKKTAEAKHA
jgi:large subunit ribosomal protein L13